MAFCINPSVPRVCSAVLHSPCPPSWQHCPLPPTPAALYGTHTSLPCPFPRGVLTSGQVRGLLSKPSGLLAPQAEGPPPLWHPYSSVTHQAGSKQTPKVPLPRAATAAQAPLHPRACALRAVEAKYGSARVRVHLHHVSQNWPEVCLVPTPSSNTLAVPPRFPASTNLVHMLSVSLAKALIKTTRKERAEGRAPKYTSRDPLRFSALRRGHCL